MSTAQEYERDRKVLEALRDLSSAIGNVRSAMQRAAADRRTAGARLAAALEAVELARDDLCDAIGALRTHRSDAYPKDNEPRMFDLEAMA